MLRSTLAAGSLLALAACHGRPSAVDAKPSTPASSTNRATATAEREPGGCATLVDTEAPDTLRLSRNRTGLALYASDQAGLALVDVEDADRPSVVALSPMTGTTIGVFQLRGAAVIVSAPWDRPGVTVVRAVDLWRTPGRTVGEIELAGEPRDARRVGEVVVVTHDLPAARPMTALATFSVNAGGLAKRDEVQLAGLGATAGASPRGLAVARETGAAQTAVTWVAIPDDTTGAMRIEGSTTIAGVIPRWRRISDRVLDVTEDDRVRVVACASAECPVGGDAIYSAIDFATPTAPRVFASAPIPRAADAVIGFQGTRLVVARAALDRSDASEIAFFDTEQALALAGAVRVRGFVGSLTVRDSGDVVALGWTGSAASGKRAIVHLLDARSTRPRLVGSTSFGGDWTWSPAYDDDRAISFDPFSTLGAIPMTTIHGTGDALPAAELIAFDPNGPRAVATENVASVDRLLFVDGRLLAFSADGVRVLHRGGSVTTEPMKW